MSPLGFRGREGRLEWGFGFGHLRIWVPGQVGEEWVSEGGGGKVGRLRGK